MKKHRIENIRKFSGASQSEITPEQIKQSREMFVNLLTPVIEKMLKSPGDIKPVKESFAELARQAKFGIVRESTIIVSAESTKNDFTEATKNDSGKETFSDEEKLILESLK